MAIHVADSVLNRIVRSWDENFPLTHIVLIRPLPWAMPLAKIRQSWRTVLWRPKGVPMRRIDTPKNPTLYTSLCSRGQVNRQKRVNRKGSPEPEID